MIKVSVIIPVYNGEVFLRQCLDSVCAQTLEDIEIICVDDASTDSSWQILEEYQQADSRIKLIKHDENQGVSAGRNTGMREAQGEYLIFWDCDDFFEPKSLDLLYTKAKKMDADICVCGADRYFVDKEKRFPFAYLNAKLLPKSDVFNRLTYPEYILNFANVAVWNKLMRKAFLEENELTFPEFAFGEDIYFTIAAICHAQRITAIKNILVHYRINNPNSLEGRTINDPRVYFYPRIAVADYLREKGIMPEQSFARRSIGTIPYVLRWASSKQAFNDTVAFLRSDSVLDKLGIREDDIDDYTPRQAEYLKHLLHDDVDELAIFVAHDTYMELRDTAAVKNEAQAKRDKFKKQITKDKEAYESELLRMTEKNGLLDEKNKQLIEAQATLTGENHRQAAILDLLEEEKQKQSTEIATLTEKNQQLIADLEVSNRDNSRLQSDFNTLTEEHRQQQADFTLLKEDKLRLELKQELLTEENQRQAATLDQLAEEKIRQLAAITALTDEKSRLEMQQKLLNAENHQLEAELEALSAQLQEIKAQLKAEKKQLKSARDKNEKLRHSVTFRLGRIILFIPRKILRLFRRK